MDAKDIFEFGLALFFIGFLSLVLYTLFKAVNRRYNKEILPGKSEMRLMERLDQMEKRLADTQEVVLSLDEKVSLGELPPQHEKQTLLQE